MCRHPLQTTPTAVFNGLARRLEWHAGRPWSGRYERFEPTGRASTRREQEASRQQPARGYLLSYASQQLGLPRPAVLAAIMLDTVAFVFLLPVFGALPDR